MFRGIIHTYSFTLCLSAFEAFVGKFVKLVESSVEKYIWSLEKGGSYSVGEKNNYF